MEIVSILKGGNKVKKIDLKEFDGPESDAKEIGPGLDCENHGGFKKDTLYLIFTNSANSRAIKKLDGESDAWLLEVKSALRKLNK